MTIHFKDLDSYIKHLTLGVSFLGKETIINCITKNDVIYANGLVSEKIYKKAEKYLVENLKFIS
jgi:hypothetical protein